MTLFDFNDADEYAWEVVNDGVMGGAFPKVIWRSTPVCSDLPAHLLHKEEASLQCVPIGP